MITFVKFLSIDVKYMINISYKKKIIIFNFLLLKLISNPFEYYLYIIEYYLNLNVNPFRKSRV